MHIEQPGGHLSPASPELAAFQSVADLARQNQIDLCLPANGQGFLDIPVRGLKTKYLGKSLLTEENILKEHGHPLSLFPVHIAGHLKGQHANGRLLVGIHLRKDKDHWRILPDLHRPAGPVFLARRTPGEEKPHKHNRYYLSHPGPLNVVEIETSCDFNGYFFVT